MRVLLAALRAVRFTVWRMRLRAEAVLAMVDRHPSKNAQSRTRLCSAAQEGLSRRHGSFESSA
jgi:hypothetical protein